jgi:exosortase
LALISFPARIIEEANPDWRLLNDFFTIQAIFLTGLVVYVSGGISWLKFFAFPLLFPLVSVPWPSELESEVIQGLQGWVAGVGTEAATWMGWSAMRQGNLIALPEGTVGISEACSGIRSLQTSLMISLFLGQYLRMPPFRRVLLIGLSVVFAFLLNLVRALFLISIVASEGGSTMLKFHDPAGITISIGTLLLLWGTANWLAPRVKPAPPATPKKSPLMAPRFAAILLLAAWLSAEVFNQVWFTLSESTTTVPAQLWTLHWPPVPDGFQPVEIDEDTKTLLHYDEGQEGRWTDQYQWDLFFMTWYPGRASAGLAQSHHPDLCLPAAGFKLQQDFGKTVLKINGIDLPFTRFTFTSPNGQLYYVFQCVTNDRVWKDSSIRVAEATNPSERLKAAWLGRRNPGQRSLLILNRGAASMDEAEVALNKLLMGCVVSQ